MTEEDNLEELLQALSDIENKLNTHRKRMCVVFLDIVGYTSFMDRHGDVAGIRRINHADSIVRPIVESHDGKVVKRLGDGWMVRFSRTRDAIEASIETQRQFFEQDRKEDDPIRIKIGMNYGRLFEDHDDIYGDVVNVAQRLESECPDNSILLSKTVYENLEPYYQHRCSKLSGLRVRGKHEPLDAYEFIWRRSEEESRQDEVKDLKLEVLWGPEESRISLKQSDDHDSALLPFITRKINHQGIENVCDGILSTIRQGNLKGDIENTQKHLEELGRQLFDLLFPIDIQENIRKSKAEYLLLKLDNSCVHIPWELAHDGQAFLSFRFSVGRVVRTRQRTSPSNRPQPTETVSFLMLSNPTGDLQSSQDECKTLYEHFSEDSRVIIEWCNGRKVDVTSKEKMKKFDILHYSGHADYCVENPDVSGWILADGRLNAGDLQEIKEEGHPFPLLVFSNACHSGTTDSWKESQESWSFGLANAFLVAGCTHFVGAVSEVLDQSGKSFPLTFYQNVISGHSVGKSLRLARKQHRENAGQDNLTWAQYVLYGDPRKPIFAGIPKAQTKRLEQSSKIPRKGTNQVESQPIMREAHELANSNNPQEERTSHSIRRMAMRWKGTAFTMGALTIGVLIAAFIFLNQSNHEQIGPFKPDLEILVLRSGTVWDLTEVGPLKTGDKLRIIGSLDRRARLCLFWLEPDGNVEVLDETGDSSSTEIVFPSDENKWVTVVGSAGIEFIGMAVGGPRTDFESILNREVAALGPLTNATGGFTFWLTREEVIKRKVQDRGIGPVEEVDVADLEYEADAIRRKMKDHFTDFIAVAIPHE